MRATPNNYQSRPMPILCQEALEILRVANRPLRCGYIGEGLFPSAILRGSAPFARIAGKVMKRLEHASLAEWHLSGDDFGGWVVTPAGRRCDY